MGYITLNTMQKLKSVGFSFPYYEFSPCVGMTFHYQGHDYLIGGSGFTYNEIDRIVFQKGSWLPSEEHLLEWLQLTNFTVDVQWDAECRYFHAKAVDTENQTCYVAGGITFVNTLAKLIYKICKSGLRRYIPEEIERIPIENDKHTNIS